MISQSARAILKSADDFSFGKVVIPTGGDDEVARLRQTMTGGFTWAVTIRLDGRQALDRYTKESLADIQALNFLDLLTQPPKYMAHDHVDQSA